METILRKLSSRKLWMAIAGVATGISLCLGADASDIQTIAGAITTVLSAASYIVTEGKVDAAHVNDAAQQVQDAVDVLENND